MTTLKYVLCVPFSATLKKNFVSQMTIRSEHFFAAEQYNLETITNYSINIDSILA